MPAVFGQNLHLFAVCVVATMLCFYACVLREKALAWTWEYLYGVVLPLSA